MVAKRKEDERKKKEEVEKKRKADLDKKKQDAAATKATRTAAPKGNVPTKRQSKDIIELLHTNKSLTIHS